jgi:hypothetical protein
MTIARKFCVYDSERQTVLERGRNRFRNFQTIERDEVSILEDAKRHQALQAHCVRLSLNIASQAVSTLLINETAIRII